MGSVSLFGADNTVQLLQNGLVFADGQDNNSGRRSRNFIRNRSAYRNTNGWVVSGACTVTRTTTTAEIVDGVASLKFAAGAAADYVKNAFTINNIQKSQPLNISFDFITQSGAAGDWDVTIFDVTAAATIVVSAPSQGGSGGNLSAGNGTFNAFFISTTNTSYELRIVRKGGSGTFSGSNFDIFQQQVRVGAAVTDMIPGVLTASNTRTSEWVLGAVTTAPTFGANSGTHIWTWRNADKMHGLVQFKQTSAGSAGLGLYLLKLPAQYTIDTTKTRTNTTNGFTAEKVGDFTASDGTIVERGYVQVYDSSTLSFFGVESNATTFSGPSSFAHNSGVNLGDTAVDIYISFTIPIANWSSNVQMADRALEEYAWNSSTTDAADSTSFGYGSAGGLVPVALTASNRSKRVRFQTQIQATDALILEVSNNAGAWVPVNSNRDGSLGYVLQNTTAYGVYLDNLVGTTDYDVTFNQYATPSGATYGSAGSSWGTLNSAGRRWRVRKVSGGSQIGGAIASINIVSDQQGIDIPAGNLGQEIRSFQSTNVAFPATASYGDITSITLTPGVWDVSALAYANINTATGFTSWVIGITSNIGNNSAGLNFGDNASICLPPMSTTDTNASIPQYRVKVTANTPYYLKFNGTYAAGSCQGRGRLSAVRVR